MKKIGFVSLFDGIPVFVGYLIPKPFLQRTGAVLFTP